MTDEERLCTALSLLLYGDALRIGVKTEQDEESPGLVDTAANYVKHDEFHSANLQANEGTEEQNCQLGQWLIDDGVLNQGIFLRSDEESDLIDIGQDGDENMTKDREEGEEEKARQTLFLAPLPPTAPPPPRIAGGSNGKGREKGRPDSPLPSAIFIRSYDGPNDDWVIA